MTPLHPTPENIWKFQQNRPTLIAEDLSTLGVPASVTYAVLLARGAFKWFAVRRDLIKLKNHWRDEVRRLQADIVRAKKSGRGYATAEYRGRLKALQECRAQVRELCHSDRWRAPDFDGPAARWLRERAPGRDVSVGLRRQLRRVSKWSCQAPHSEACND